MTAGRRLSDEECDRFWHAWTPAEATERLSGAPPCWYVTAGWALDLFVGGLGRAHSDLEIGVPRERFAEIVDALPGYAWDDVGDGQVWPFPEALDNHHQTWLRDPETGRYRLDVFREPHCGDRWMYRRDSTITLPYDELILRTPDGIPYAIPEVDLLFNANAQSRGRGGLLARAPVDGPIATIPTVRVAVSSTLGPSLSGDAVEAWSELATAIRSTCLDEVKSRNLLRQVAKEFERGEH